MTGENKKKIELKVTAAQLVNNIDAMVDAMPIGVLRKMHKILMPKAEPLKGKHITRRLRSAIKKHLLLQEMPKPQEPERRNLNFAPIVADPVATYSTEKTADEIDQAVQQRVTDWLAENGGNVAQFCIGKASGANPRDALYPRYRDTYSKPDFGYTNMMLLYKDDGTDKQFHGAREKRALKVEETAHAQFNTHVKWDTRVNDSPGPKSRNRSARFYVYLAYKLVE